MGVKLMVNPDKKPIVKKKQYKNVMDFIKNNSNYGYYYDSRYDNPFERNPGLNCNDFEYHEETVNRLKGKFVREHIARKATPEELEWINQQERVTDPQVLEELRPILEWLSKYVF